MVTQNNVTGAQADVKKYENLLNQSSTAYRSTPTSSDLKLQTEMRAARNRLSEERDNQIQERWFSQEKPETSGGESGGFGKALESLAVPVYATVGAFEHLTGRGTESTLMGDVNKNMWEDRRLFSDVLRDRGAPGVVSAPLGFALDVMFDPLNWATAGTAALIPRLATGAAKGGVKGAALGATSYGARRAGQVLKAAEFVPGVRKGVDTSLKMSKRLSKSAKEFEPEAVSGFRARLNNKAVSSAEEYNKLVGKDIVKDIESYRGLGKGSYRVTLRGLVDEAKEKMPWARPTLEALDYNNVRHMELSRKKREIMKALNKNFDDKGDVQDALNSIIAGDETAARESLERARTSFLEGARQTKVSTAADDVLEYNPESPLIKDMLEDAPESARKAVEKIQEGVEDVSDILGDAERVYTTMDPLENGLRMAMENLDADITVKDIKEMLEAGLMDKTGLDWFDNAYESVRNWKVGIKAINPEKKYEVGKGMVESLEFLTSFFKRGKVAGSPSAWTNAILGNPIMAAMLGINIADPKFLESVRKARKIISSKDGMAEAIEEMFSNVEMMKYLMDNPEEFAQLTGISPTYLKTKRQMARQIEQMAMDAGIPTKGKSTEEIFDVIKEELEDSYEKISGYKAAPTTGSDLVRNMIKQRGREVLTPFDLPGSMIANEIVDSGLSRKFYDDIAEKAKDPKNVGARVTNFFFNKALSGYERIDQIYKMAMHNHLVMNGLTEPELAKIARAIDMVPEDIIEKAAVDGVMRYKLSGRKAAEVANEIYLNYAAMPAGVKALRKMPILGAPFASFMHGMGLKTASTIAYNPAIFNKVNYAMSSTEPAKSPLERKSLESKYYSYLNDPAMWKMPFFRDNPIYLNMANMLPYYSMNMFNPTERVYEETIPGNLVQLIDKSPLLDDPVGQVMFDYLILPLILRDSQPMGSFGQPIYPKGASALEKTGYAARALVDTYTPGAVGLLGSPIGAMTDIPAGVLPGYHTRKSANAARGLTTYGKTSSEPALQRTARAVAGNIGFPVQSPVNFRYLENEVKKNIKSSDKN